MLQTRKLLDLSECLCILFADDTTVFKTGKDHKYLNCISRDMATLADWFRANKLSLNLSKSNCILFRKKGQPIDDNFQLVIGNEIISLVKDAKFLGLFIDENLTWRAHIAKIRHNISSGLYMLNNTRNFLPSDQKKTVYMSFVNSHILYGVLLWGTMALTGDVSKLSRQQNKAMRAINNKRRNFPTNPLYKTYNKIQAPMKYFLKILKNVDFKSMGIYPF